MHESYSTSAQAHLALAILHVSPPEKPLGQAASAVLALALRTPGWSGVTSTTPVFASMENGDAQLQAQVVLLQQVFEFLTSALYQFIAQPETPLALRKQIAETFHGAMRIIDPTYELPNEVVAQLLQ